MTTINPDSDLKKNGNNLKFILFFFFFCLLAHFNIIYKVSLILITCKLHVCFFLIKLNFKLNLRRGGIHLNIRYLKVNQIWE